MRPKSADITAVEALVTGAERTRLTGLRGATVWLTGLSGSGKSTIGGELERLLLDQGLPALLLDGDNLRHGVNADLGFSPQDRAEAVRRSGEIAMLLNAAGVVSVVSLISPYAADRDAVRERHRDTGMTFLEVHVDTPLEVCEERDPKGLYARARRGDIEEFTGVSAPYETPVAPDLRTDPTRSAAENAARIRDLLHTTRNQQVARRSAKAQRTT